MKEIGSCRLQMKISVKLGLQCYHRDVARIMHTGIDFSKNNEHFLGWGKKDTNIIGPTILEDKS